MYNILLTSMAQITFVRLSWVRMFWLYKLYAYISQLRYGVSLVWRDICVLCFLLLQTSSR